MGGGAVDMFIILLVVRVSWVYTYVKLIKFYIFNMCHLLYANYTSIQMLKQTNHSLNCDRKVT